VYNIGTSRPIAAALRQSSVQRERSAACRDVCEAIGEMRLVSVLCPLISIFHLPSVFWYSTGHATVSISKGIGVRVSYRRDFPGGHLLEDLNQKQKHSRQVR